ncbi:M48 family metalloprotease [Streptomyces rimosus]|uniref:M48 family metalloprotease n=1 Tax=Streptomyces rimosus TaxID=1927 RepID=UPI0004C586B0|nr:M48 family metalloprotease [Streptomyces rimosus]
MKSFPALRSLTGTGARFALLMVMVTAAAVPAFDTLLSILRDRGDKGVSQLRGTMGCLYAAGFDPRGSDLDNLMATMRRGGLLTKCFAEHAERPYAGLLATLALFVLAALVYWFLPAVRDRRRRTVAVGEVDADGTLGAELAALHERTGIRSALRFRVDPARMTSGAAVYGRTGSYTVCLHAGLLARRGTDPEGFRAVVLHELAHVHHRDVDYAYASTALWRVFVLLALLPTLAMDAWITVLALSGTDSPWWPDAATVIFASAGAGLLLAGLVHLARADLLRRRELHADVQAMEWGADPANWNRPEPPGTASVVPLLYRLAAPLRTHPGWAERRRVLADTGRLSRISPLEMFLTGASAALVTSSLGTLSFLGEGSTSLWLAVALVAPVICLILGAPIVRARRTPAGRTGSGAVAGLWLGCGLLVGEWVESGRYRVDWFMPQPQYLLAFLFIAAVPTVWWSQTLRLCLGLPKRMQRRAAAVLCAAVTAAVLWSGLWWWELGGRRIALGGGDMGGGGLAKYYARTVPGFWHEYTMDLSGLSWGLALITPLHREQLAGAATILMWLVPLVLLLLQRPGARPRMRRTLVAGLVGGLLAWAGVALASFMLHFQRPGTPKERTGPFLVVHEWWTIVAVMAACLLTAALVAAFSRRHQLLRALIAAQVTQLAAYAGVFLLYAADGCLGPLNTVFDRCQWHTDNGVNVGRAVVLLTLVSTVLGSACAALLGVGAVGAVRWVRRRRAAVSGSVRAHVPAPAPTAVTPVRRAAVFLRAGTVLALAAPAVLLAVVANTTPTSPAMSARLQQESTEQGKQPPDKQPTKPQGNNEVETAKLRSWQTWSWLNDGGAVHVQQVARAALSLNKEILRTAAKERQVNGKVNVDEKTFNRLCGALGKRAAEAEDYFPVPVQDLQKPWSNALSRLRHGARNCQAVTTTPHGNPPRTPAERERLFNASLDEVIKGIADLGNAYRSIYKTADTHGK